MIASASLSRCFTSSTIIREDKGDCEEQAVEDTATSSNTNNFSNSLDQFQNMNGNTSEINNHSNNLYEDFFRKCVEEILKSAVFDGTSRDTKVVEWHDPEELAKIFDFKVQEYSENHAQLLNIIKKTIHYSVKTGHPYFINQLYSGTDPYALIGQWLTDALNPSVYTYEVAPVFILMEEEVLAEMRRIIGFPNNGEGDGIFCPGGSISNGYAISCARHTCSPSVKLNGLFGEKRLIIFTSEDAHYSLEKLAMFMGVGSQNVCKIPTDYRGKMILSHLRKEIERSISENSCPMMVSATAGTTVLGAFDDLDGIADLCSQYNMWMHVDAAWGGGALVSKKYKLLLKGIERADSVTWNPHKLLTASQQCSTFLTRHKNVLKECHSTNASYLFQKDKFYNTEYDTGDKHIQCGRKADVFKFWFMWKAKGTTGFENHVNHLFQMAKYFTVELKKRDNFDLVIKNPECTNITFWYTPPSLKNLEKNNDYYRKLHVVAPKIKERMMKKGSMMITYQPLRKLPNFFRLVLQNPCLQKSDMVYFLDEIERLGNNL